MSVKTEVLWQEYKRTGSITLRNELVVRYLNLVDYLAERMSKRLPRCVDVEEVRSAGVLGLMDAVEGFDLSRGIKFETYCSHRVRGSILDELRARDWVPKLVRSRAQKFKAAVRNLTKRLGRPVTDQEIMDDLGMSPAEYQEQRTTLLRLSVKSLDAEHGKEGDTYSHGARVPDTRQGDPTEELHKKEMTASLLATLSEQHRAILTLYYFDCLTMKEIGRRLNLSECRICQIHGEIIKQLRELVA